MPRNRWQADVAVRLLDGEGLPVSGALVEGLWSAGANGSESVATDGGGWAAFTKSNIKGGTPSVRFDVTAVTMTGYVYSSADNTDPDGDSDGTGMVITKDAPPPPENGQPTVVISAPSDGQVFVDGTAIELTATASDPEEGDLAAAIVWRVNGVEVASGASTSHNFADGSHTVEASAADSEGASGSDSVSITVGEPPSETTVHVASLVDDSTVGSRRWTAIATVTVHDAAGAPVSNVTVDASWSNGAEATPITQA